MFFKNKRKPPESALPGHIEIILDGNGRWAKKRGLSRSAGHRKGAETFKKIALYANRIGVKCLSAYAFSTENWKRPEDEVSGLMKLLEEYLDNIGEFEKENVRVIFIGEKKRLSKKLCDKMTEIEEKSAERTGMILAIAINYGGRQEIVSAVRNTAKLSKEGFVSDEQIDEAFFESMLDTGKLPDVDLLIRPGGEKRISNFLLWKISYAEIYFCDTLWPDYTEKDLDEAVLWYSKRNRRFGGV